LSLDCGQQGVVGGGKGFKVEKIQRSKENVKIEISKGILRT
jgi:hypothetical protein